MSRQFALLPKKSAPVKTKFRKIVTDIPAPKSIPILEALRRAEPISMTGQPPVLWDRARGFQVFDRWGNCWIDWSSGVLVASAGHGRKEVIASIKQALLKPLLHNYCFPNEYRAKLATKIVELAPEGLNKCFLLTTGSEAVECIIKISRTYGQKIGGPYKNIIVTFNGDFHGRTMGSQLAGGSSALKEWIGPTADKGFVQVNLPGDFRTKDNSFEGFVDALEAKGATADRICLVLPETFQGGSTAFMPVEFAKKLREWTTANRIVLGFDEIQAGFGRCGTLWGFEHYDVAPDIFCLGKSISGSLPLSAVVGRQELMDLFAPNSMTSTHTGNPVCCAAALAAVNIILKEKLVQKAAKMGALLHAGLNRVRERFPSNIAPVQGRGMVAGVHMVKPGTGMEPDPDAAFDIVERCMEKGLLMFAPVGVGDATVKIAPPLVIPKEAIIEGLGAFEEAVSEVLANRLS
jgi:4-aminobutyrate aminotransferase/(S)-3-amino-2-methylpropionate transaminase